MNAYEKFLQDIENYLRNNSSDSRIEKIQEVGKDLLELCFLKGEIEIEITEMMDRRDQLHHQVCNQIIFQKYILPVW